MLDMKFMSGVYYFTQLCYVRCLRRIPERPDYIEGEASDDPLLVDSEIWELLCTFGSSCHVDDLYTTVVVIERYSSVRVLQES